MDIEFILEAAKELLEKAKGLVPVLFVETENDMNIVEIIGDLNNIDRREMMTNFGRTFAMKGQRVKSLSLVSEANVTIIRKSDGSIEKCETIVVAKLDMISNEKRIIAQDFERLNDGIIFLDSHHELGVEGVFLLDAFVEGYHQILGMKMN